MTTRPLRATPAPWAALAAALGDHWRYVADRAAGYDRPAGYALLEGRGDELLLVTDPDGRAGCRIPREMRPIPQHLRRCSADPAPTLQNCLSMRRPSRHDAGMGAGSVGRSAGSAHLARNKSASRVE